MKSIILVLIFMLSSLSIYSQEKFNIKNDRSTFLETEKLSFIRQSNYSEKNITDNQEQFDIMSYELNLTIKPDEKILEGSVQITGKSLTNGLDHLEIDLYDPMVVNSVFQNGNSLTFVHNNGIINISLPDILNQDDIFIIEVFYAGNPEQTGYGAFNWDIHGPQSEYIIWTLSEPFGSPSWWPCKDDPADKADSVFLNITVPSNLVVASNGVLKKIDRLNSNYRTHSWATHYPINPPLVSLAISDYEILNDTYISAANDTMMITHYIYPELLSNAEVDMPITKDMILEFANYFGEYPFINEKYGNALFPFRGGMEHQTMCSYGASLVTGDNRYDWLNAHEVAHQWFGDAIALSSWSHVWMKEGFASYAEALWEESIGGYQAYHNYMTEVQYADSWPGSVFIYDSTNAQALFSRTVYDKGAWVLHMLRGVLGDEVFFNSLNSYATDPRFLNKSASTEDFQSVCETISGMELEWFFQEWVYRAGRPNYNYQWEVSGDGPFATTLTLYQDSQNLYKMPIQIMLTGNGFDTLFTVGDSLEMQIFEFNTNFEPLSLTVDPNDWILKNIREGALYTINGTVLDAADSSGKSDVTVLWEGPIDPIFGIGDSFGSETTDQNGNFQMQRFNGVYALYAVKESYLQSDFQFISLDQNIDDIKIWLTQPEAEFDIDSLFYILSDDLEADTLLNTTNIGSGELFIQAVEGNHVQNSGGMTGIHTQPAHFPLQKMLEKRNIAVQSDEAVTDDNWMLLHTDLMENPDNYYDVENTYVKKEGNNILFKFTTYNQPQAYENMRFNIFIDTDNDVSTGQPIWGLGSEFLIAIGDFGNGYTGYILEHNPAIQDFEFVTITNLFSANPSTKSVTVGINSSLINNPSKISFLVNSFDFENFLETFDVVPSFSLGYLSASLTDVPWLNISPYFSTIKSDEESTINISINPSEERSGNYLSGVTVFYSSPGGMKQYYMPILLDYTTDINDDYSDIPDFYSLEQNYPNPFNPTTKIKFSLPERAKVLIELYNIIGERVDILIDEELNSGYHEINFNAGNLSSGIYFYRINAGKFMESKKLILMK